VSLPHGGQPVKWLGDGAMFHFKRPGQGVVAALEMVERTPRPGCPGQVLVSDQLVAECPAGPVSLHRAARKTPGG
jgi:hypothetical protein